ncbi:hypothetical protein OWR29_09990 [Actinoplanes sp. Pm04-4]|uniref:Uncharacterized protein n=1 Tax=Paractinoplanes pyxinae TaxID=2997416 RepID=A0ABT4AY90_9ACTN|nr:hypothetical protein [Actinoplanes pyxinae]MCY1138328.1 hypothetical protein [Actinoplanes pyxinae]
MTNILEQSEAGREIARRGWRKGFAQIYAKGVSHSLELRLSEGLEQVLEQVLEDGWRQGHVDAMWTLLRAKYGNVDDLDDLAQQLTDSDHDGNIVRIVGGATLAELRS